MPKQCLKNQPFWDQFYQKPVQRDFAPMFEWPDFAKVRCVGSICVYTTSSANGAICFSFMCSHGFFRVCNETFVVALTARNSSLVATVHGTLHRALECTTESKCAWFTGLQVSLTHATFFYPHEDAYAKHRRNLLPNHGCHASCPNRPGCGDSDRHIDMGHSSAQSKLHLATSSRVVGRVRPHMYGKNMSQVPSGLKHGIFQHWIFAPHLAGKKTFTIFPEKGAKVVTDLRPVVDTRFCMFIPQGVWRTQFKEVRLLDKPAVTRLLL